MSTASNLSTADLIRSHDFAHGGDGYATIRAAGQLTRGNSMVRLASLINGFTEQLRQLERTRDLRLQERLQQMAMPLVNPVDQRVLGLQMPGPDGISALSADLATVGLVPQVDSWHYLRITVESTPPSSSEQYFSAAQFPLVMGFLAQANEDLGSQGGIHHYAFSSIEGEKTVRSVISIGESPTATLAPGEVARLQQALQAVMTQRLGDLQQLAVALEQQQQAAAQDWMHGSAIDTYWQARILRCQQGLSSTP